MTKKQPKNNVIRVAQGHETVPMGNDTKIVHWSGPCRVPARELRAAVRAGWLKTVRQEWNGPIFIRYAGRYGIIRFGLRKNLVVNSGIQRSLDRLFNRPSGSVPGPVVRMGVDNGASNPTATTDQSGANTKTLLAFDAEPTRTANVVTATRTFTNSNVNFAIKRLFLSAHTADITNSTSADTAGTLYSMTNATTIDFTPFTTWSWTVSATVTGAGS